MPQLGMVDIAQKDQKIIETYPTEITNSRSTDPCGRCFRTPGISPFHIRNESTSPKGVEKGSSLVLDGYRDWWSQTGSNRRPHACKARALPAELWPLSVWLVPEAARPEARLRLPAGPPVQPLEVVGLGRFELPTSRLSSARSNQLSYRP